MPVYKPNSQSLETATASFNILQFVGVEPATHPYEEDGGRKQVECCRVYFDGGPPHGLLVAMTPQEYIEKLVEWSRELLQAPRVLTP